MQDRARPVRRQRLAQQRPRGQQGFGASLPEAALVVQLQVSKTYACFGRTGLFCLLTCATGKVEWICARFYSDHTPRCMMLASTWCSRYNSALSILDQAAIPQLLTCLDNEEGHCKAQEEIDANHDGDAAC